MMNGSRIVSKIITSKAVHTAFNHRVARNISRTSFREVRVIEVVPALGESITEGSIASWSKEVGERVEIDDVIVIVETDKVTVDIKSTNAGVLMAKLADENVVVGAPLYELETEATGAATIAAPAATPAAAAPAAATPAEPAHTEEKSHGRIPSIKFIGKRSLVKAAEIVPAPVAVAAPTPTPAPVKVTPPAPKKFIKEGTGIDFTTLHRGAMFGRPALSQREMDSIESGGATY